MKIQAKEVLRPTVTLTLICLVIAALLAGTNLLTKDKIAEQEEEAAREARELVLPGIKDFEEAQVTDAEGANVIYYVGKENGETAGYVFTTSASSYGGPVQVMTGMQVEGSVSGVELLSIDDTPGLGMNAEKEDFRAQFHQAVPESGEFEVIKSGEKQDGQIMAMTGATITTQGVTDAVNEALALYETVKGGA